MSGNTESQTVALNGTTPTEGTGCCSGAEPMKTKSISSTGLVLFKSFAKGAIVDLEAENKFPLGPGAAEVTAALKGKALLTPEELATTAGETFFNVSSFHWGARNTAGYYERLAVDAQKRLHAVDTEKWTVKAELVTMIRKEVAKSILPSNAPTGGAAAIVPASEVAFSTEDRWVLVISHEGAAEIPELEDKDLRKNEAFQKVLLATGFAYPRVVELAFPNREE